MNRRSFFRRLGGALAGVYVAPLLKFLPVAAPVRSGLTVAQIVAVSYPAVLTQMRRPGHQWAESAFLRELERRGHVTRVEPIQIELPLHYERQPDYIIN